MTYYADFAPGAGRRAPRAALDSDAPSVDLTGTWRFRLSPRADVPDDFAAPDFDDSGWLVLPVPSHWPLYGHGAPAYTNVAYPFPIDPPHPPEDNPTGDHRREFDLPDDWAGATPCCGSTASSRARGCGSTAPSSASSPAAGCPPSSTSATCWCRGATCSPSACTSGRRAATSRTRTCGGCRGSSAA